VSKNNSFTIFSNNSVLVYGDKLNFNPKSVVINEKSLKLHDYNFLYSDKISSNYSHLIVSSSKNYCLSIFVAVDKHCSLEIVLNVKEKNNSSKIVNGFNDNEGLKIWKEVTIRSNFSGQGKLSFFRRCLGSRTTGYWAIDAIHFCDKNIETFSATLLSDNKGQHICKNLNAQDKGENNENVCDKPGYVGKYCNISCEELLGKTYSKCEKHKICLENEICYCAWGYKGRSCAETCNNGYWELNCSLTCDKKTCGNCDFVYGCTKCRHPFFGNDCSKKLPVLVNPPSLKSITEESGEIIVDLDYGVNETMPEFWQVRYKKVHESVYKNYSALLVVSLSLLAQSQMYTIHNLSTETHAYNIRVILTVQNQSCVENIKELKTYKSEYY
jgi:hypothetical protein